MQRFCGKTGAVQRTAEHAQNTGQQKQECKCVTNGSTTPLTIEDGAENFDSDTDPWRGCGKIHMRKGSRTNVVLHLNEARQWVCAL